MYLFFGFCRDYCGGCDYGCECCGFWKGSDEIGIVNIYNGGV